MVLSPPAGIVGAVALFSSPIPSHLSSSRHRRTKEALNPWHNRREGFPVDRHLFKRPVTSHSSLAVTFLPPSPPVSAAALINMAWFVHLLIIPILGFGFFDF
ncbi:hypothetical protein AHAS_Ahas11G0098500 [Arachis hypogaea]